ncbi:MAG: hypothetical protein Q8L69_00700, partial [Gallionellaceae bacterium]|nr:hypothetical protein [Gallionellaceae bacterium]
QPKILELTQQFRQPSEAASNEVNIRFRTAQYSKCKALADDLRASLANTDREIDRDVLEIFCRRVLPVTFLGWMHKTAWPVIDDSVVRRN